MRALVLSGGGCKGAYEAGAVRHLMGDLGLEYSLVCGVSVGALNGAVLCGHSPGRERVASDALDSLWSSTGNSSVYRRWFPFGKLSGLWKGSMLDSSPLHKMARSTLDPQAIRTSGRALRVGATSLNTGKYRLFDESYHDVVGAVLASSAFPSMLLPVELDGELWTDGGIREVTPLKAAVEAGATDVDVVMTFPPFTPPGFPSSPSAVDVALRSIEIMSDSIVENDLGRALAYNRYAESGLMPGRRSVNIRVIRPSNVLTADPLDFSPRLIESMWFRGYSDACTATR